MPPWHVPWHGQTTISSPVSAHLPVRRHSSFPWQPPPLWPLTPKLTRACVVPSARRSVPLPRLQVRPRKSRWLYTLWHSLPRCLRGRLRSRQQRLVPQLSIVSAAEEEWATKQWLGAFMLCPSMQNWGGRVGTLTFGPDPTPANPIATDSSSCA